MPAMGGVGMGGMGGMGGRGNFRPGDWLCRCGNHNFARNTYWYVQYIRSVN